MADICHLNLAPHFRGGERQTELLLRALASLGFSQRLVIKRGNSLRERCADVRDLEIREVSPNPLAAGLAIRGSRVAHAHDGRTVYSALFARYVYGIPYVITRRVVARQAASYFRRLAYRNARAVAAVSDAAVAELQVRQPDIEPIVIADATANFPVDAEEVARIRAARPGKTLIGHVGALDHSHKGQSTVIEVARRVVTSHPDWHFLLCGDGRDEARFRDEIGELSNVELVGWVENVGDYLASFDLFVYPSLHEALGSSILDAMQLGLPVVASNVGGIPGIVKDGVNGRLIEPEEPGELLAAIESLLGDVEQQKSVSAANRSVATRFGAQAMAAAYLETYAIGDPGPG